MSVHLHVCMCTVGRSEKALDPLKLESQMVVNQHVGARNWTGPLGEQAVP